MSHTNDDYELRDLLIAIELQQGQLHQARAIALGEIDRLNGVQASFGYHPNYLGYLYGSVYASRAMGAAHILPLAGLHLLPFDGVIDRLESAITGDPATGDALTAVRLACENDQTLEAKGFAWCGEVGLLKRGAVDPYWLKKPTLGLGQPARTHGLLREHHEGHRGLHALALPDLRERFEAVASGAPDASFGGLVLRVIEAGGPMLAALGAAAIHHDAKVRYVEDGRRFAAFQQATGRDDWRGKPPLRGQGFLAARTTTAKGVEMPAERTRGTASDWLDSNGANVRFRED